VPGDDRPLMSANLTRLRVLFREGKADAGTLEEIRDELRRRRMPGAKELLKSVEKELDVLARGQTTFMNGEKTECSAMKAKVGL
jgi:hypothetical protein